MAFVSKKALDRGRHWELPFGSGFVARCAVDSGFTIEIGDQHCEYFARIQGKFALSRENGEELQLAGDGQEKLGPAMTLLWRVIVACDATKLGTLEIVFADTTRLVVPKSESLEAWEYVGQDGLRVVSSIGGELAIWQPEVVSDPGDHQL